MRTGAGFKIVQGKTVSVQEGAGTGREQLASGQDAFEENAQTLVAQSVIDDGATGRKSGYANATDAANTSNNRQQGVDNPSQGTSSVHIPDSKSTKDI